MASGLISASLTETKDRGSYGGFSLMFNLVHKIAATAFVAADINLAAINITCQIAGRTSSMALRDFIALFCYKGVNFQAIRDWTLVSQTTLVQAGGVFETRTLNLRFRFSNAFTLRGGKVCSVTVNPGAAFSTTNVGSTSTMELRWFDGFAISPGYPVFKKRAAEANANMVSMPIEKNTNKIIIYNHNLSDTLIATSAISGAVLTTDKGGFNWDQNDLYAKRNDDFETATNANLRFANFDLSPKSGTDFDSGEVSVNYVSANVSADNNGILIEALDIDGESFAGFSEQIVRHEERAVNNLPLEAKQMLVRNKEITRVNPSTGLPMPLSTRG